MGQKIPQWVFAIGATCISALIVVSAGMGSYIFTRLAGKVDSMEETLGRLNQQVAVMQAQIETQGRFMRQPVRNARFPKTNDEGE